MWELETGMKFKISPLPKQKEKEKKKYSSNKSGLKTNIFLKSSGTREILNLFSYIWKTALTLQFPGCV